MVAYRDREARKDMRAVLEAQPASVMDALFIMAALDITLRWAPAQRWWKATRGRYSYSLPRDRAMALVNAGILRKTVAKDGGKELRWVWDKNAEIIRKAVLDGATVRPYAATRERKQLRALQKQARALECRAPAVLDDPNDIRDRISALQRQLKMHENY